VAGDTINLLVQRTAGTGSVDTTYGVELRATTAGGFPWGPSTFATAALNASGGTGGIIIDNALGGGGSQIYYATRSQGNAIQASQKLLK
jgi:hypothetical protein